MDGELELPGATAVAPLAASVGLSEVLVDDDLRHVAKVELAEHLLGVGVDLNDVEGNLRDVRDVVVLALTLLLLELEGNALDGALLNTAHEVREEPGNLVPHPLGRDHSNLIADPLVDLEVQCQARVVLLDDELGSPLDGLVPDASLQVTHSVSRDKQSQSTRQQREGRGGSVGGREKDDNKRHHTK